MSFSLFKKVTPEIDTLPETTDQDNYKPDVLPEELRPLESTIKNLVLQYELVNNIKLGIYFMWCSVFEYVEGANPKITLHIVASNPSLVIGPAGANAKSLAKFIGEKTRHFVFVRADYQFNPYTEDVVDFINYKTNLI